MSILCALTTIHDIIVGKWTIEHSNFWSDYPQSQNIKCIYLLSIFLNILTNLLITLGSIELARSRGNQPLCKSRASLGSFGAAKFEVCSSYWLCQSFPIYGEYYSTCKVHELHETRVILSLFMFLSFVSYLCTVMYLFF